VSLAPAKVRVEIIREPLYFDDHFCKGWDGGQPPAWAGTALSGDLVTLTVQAGYSYYHYARPLEFSPVTSSYFVVRVTEVSSGATWRIMVRRKSDATWLFGPIQSGVGVFVFDIYALLGTTVDQIGIGVYDAPGKYVRFDYVAITDHIDEVVPDMGDLVEELTVTRPLLNNGICGANLSIPNSGGAYNGLIKAQDVILIWIARAEADLGNPYYKAFGGRIENPINRGDGYGAFYIDLDCHGHAYELNIPPALFQAYCPAINGRTIIEAALALCTYLTRHPAGNFWFDSLGSSGSTDDRIDSTHDVVYDEVVPMTAIQEILEKAKNPAAAQGFDVYETPAGCLIGHLRNSLDFTWPYNTLIPSSYVKGADLHRVRNKTKVYGSRNKALPTDKESWTESLSGWTTGSGTLYLDATHKIVGTYCLELLGDNCWMYRTFAAISCGNQYKKSYGALSFWIWEFQGKEIEIRLLAPDASNYFARKITNILAWTRMTWNLGVENEAEWTKTGSPDWNNIQGFRAGVNGTSSIELWLDGLYFYPTRFMGEANDSASQAVYGVRASEPIVDDSLQSDAECVAKAESIKAVLKDPVITLSDVVVDGDYWMDPGVRARIVVANDGLDAYFRIVQAKHVVKGTHWDARLTLSNEPQYVDYVFKLLQEEQMLLQRKS
jgi:hypothetical protein